MHLVQLIKRTGKISNVMASNETVSNKINATTL